MSNDLKKTALVAMTAVSSLMVIGICAVTLILENTMVLWSLIFPFLSMVFVLNQIQTEEKEE